MNMNRNLLLGAGIIIVVIVGYMLFSRGQTTPPAPTIPAVEEKTTVSPTPLEITVTLDEQNKSSESGTAKLMEVDGKVKLTLLLTGATKGVTQPAHIHVGVCPNVGAVKYPLTSPVNGISETTLDVTLAQLKSELPLGVNVHKSEKEAKVYVSCGDLAL